MPDMPLTPVRRDEIIDALRRGTVPRSGLDAFAVGLQPFEKTFDEELRKVAGGGSGFKAVRGDYGCGKTFFTRWLAQKARMLGFATSEVRIHSTEVPLHRLDTVYSRLMKELSTDSSPQGAWRSIVDGWFFALEEDVRAETKINPSDREALDKRVTELLEMKLAKVSGTAFGPVLRAYREAQMKGDRLTADSLLRWLAGQPDVAAAAKRVAGVKGEIDQVGALDFLQGMLTVLHDAGHPGLLVVLDEVETIQRARSDVREKGLEALARLIDQIDDGRFPGLYLVITGTTSFFDGPQGIRRSEPLSQRLHTEFVAEHVNPRAVQILLPPFVPDRLCEVGRKVRGIYQQGSQASQRIAELCDDDYVEKLALAVAGELGGKVGVAPRIFLKKLVVNVLDLIDLAPTFHPRKDYKLTLDDQELTREERQARNAMNADDIELQIDEDE